MRHPVGAHHRQYHDALPHLPFDIYRDEAIVTHPGNEDDDDCTVREYHAVPSHFGPYDVVHRVSPPRNGELEGRHVKKCVHHQENGCPMRRIKIHVAGRHPFVHAVREVDKRCDTEYFVHVEETSIFMSEETVPLTQIDIQGVIQGPHGIGLVPL